MTQAPLRLLILLVAAGLASTGLALGGSPGPAADSSQEPLALTLRTDAVPLAPRDHRISEWTLSADPNNPSHLFAAAMDWDHATGGGVACAGFHSIDAGRSWQPSSPIPGLDAAHARIDPWGTIDPDGTAHLACIDHPSEPASSGEPVQTRILAARSPDGGATWQQATPVLPGGRGGDRLVLLAGSDGDLFHCVSAMGGVTFSASRDSGQSWQEPVVVRGVRACHWMAEGPNGNLYASVYRWPAPEVPELGFHIEAPLCWPIGTVTSRDRGANWEPMLDVAESCRAGDQDDADTSDRRPGRGATSITASPTTGAVILTNSLWDETRHHRTFALHRSVDGARTFDELGLSPPISPTCDACHATYPVVAYDNAGRLGLQYAVIADFGATREVWFTASNDDGNTWADPLRITASQQPAVDPWMRLPRNPATIEATLDYYADNPEEIGALSMTAIGVTLRPDHFRWGGDYWGLTHTTDGFVASWHEPTQDGGSRVFTRVIGAG